MSQGCSLLPYMWKTPRWSHAPCLWDQHSTNLGQYDKSLDDWFSRSFSCCLFTFCILNQRNLGGSSSLVFESRVAKESEEEPSSPWVFSKEKTSKPEELFSFYFHSPFLRRENFQTWGASSPQAEQVEDQESRHLANDSVWKVNERVYDEDRSSKCTRHRCKSC